MVNRYKELLEWAAKYCEDNPDFMKRSPEMEVWLMHTNRLLNDKGENRLRNAP